MTQPAQQGAASPSTQFQAVTMPGVIEEGPIRLVSASSANQALQIVGAIVGALGGAFIGAAIGAVVAESPMLPIEAIQTLAAKCAAEPVHCKLLTVSTLTNKNLVFAAVAIGGILLAIQIALQVLPWWSRRVRDGSTRKNVVSGTSPGP
jgi:hypothetical protein